MPPLPANTRILEGVVTSRDAGGAVNVAPMGPIVDERMARLILRPFTTSTTYANLKATRQGVFHVTDDALMIARGAMGKLRAVTDDEPSDAPSGGRGGTNKPGDPSPADPSPADAGSGDAGTGDASYANTHFVDVQPAHVVDGVVLSEACRWYEFEVESIEPAGDAADDPAAARPTRIEATVVHVGRRRDFLGFNRAKHAVLEAAILATRIHLTGAQHVMDELDRLQVTVEKTGGDDEHQAMAELRAFVKAALRGE